MGSLFFITKKYESMSCEKDLEERLVLRIKKIYLERRKRMEQKTIYYISEAAKKVQVESHVLRYWEDELELPIMRNEMGHRCYTEKDIRQLQEIKQLKEQGLQLKAIRTILFRLPDNMGNKADDLLMQQVSQTVEMERNPAESGRTAVEQGEIAGDRNMKESLINDRTELQAEKTMEVNADKEEGDRREEKTEERGNEMDITGPQRFVVALSKEKEEVEEKEYADTDKNRKAARLQYLLQHMITEAVKSANRELCTDVKESILKELDYQFRMQEERDEERWKREEEHYRKIDEMIRERHKPKDRLGRGKRKSPVKDDLTNI